MTTQKAFKIADPFLEKGTLDRYWVKFSILRAIRTALPEFHGTLLDVGCGSQPYRELLTSSPSRVSRYLGLDLEGPLYGGEGAPEPDLRWDGRRVPLEDGEIEVVFGTEVLEHCPDPRAVLAEIHRVLKPGGLLFFTVPFLWPLHDSPHDYYRYTPFALQHILAEAGFRDVELRPLGGWDAALGQMLGLWVKRRPISSRHEPFIRQMLEVAALPALRLLFGRDQAPEMLVSNPMITGVSGTARK